MAELVYVDNSNVFIEGKRAKAVASGMAMNIYDVNRPGFCGGSNS